MFKMQSANFSDFFPPQTRTPRILNFDPIPYPNVSSKWLLLPTTTSTTTTPAVGEQPEPFQETCQTILPTMPSKSSSKELRFTTHSIENEINNHEESEHEEEKEDDKMEDFIEVTA